MRVVEVPVLSDNYAYLIIDDSNKIAITVDPAEPKKVLEKAKQEGVKVAAIATTHHHYDHAGGNEEFLSLIKPESIPVYAGDDRISPTNKVGHGDQFEIGDLHVKVLFTPCHTTGHVLYFVTSKSSPEEPAALFSGDTLFIAGCGRFFEGTAQQMHHALCEVVASLPDNTKVYCGHEYTVSNLKFAKSVEPDNEFVQKKLDWALEKRANQLPTIPSTVGEEKKYNPFMRVNEPSIQKSLGVSDAIKAMDELRTRKNNF